MEVARHVLRTRARGRALGAVGGGAPRASSCLDPAVAEEKLDVLVTGARQARLYLAKEQFDI